MTSEKKVTKKYHADNPQSFTLYFILLGPNTRKIKMTVITCGTQLYFLEMLKYFLESLVLLLSTWKVSVFFFLWHVNMIYNLLNSLWKKIVLTLHQLNHSYNCSSAFFCCLFQITFWRFNYANRFIEARSISMPSPTFLVPSTDFLSDWSQDFGWVLSKHYHITFKTSMLCWLEENMF